MLTIGENNAGNFQWANPGPYRYPLNDPIYRNIIACETLIPSYRCPSAALQDYQYDISADNWHVMRRVPGSYLGCASGVAIDQNDPLGLDEMDGVLVGFDKDKKDRVLLCAHWDSRPFADHDPDPANHFKPVMGANDGASGVGVLLEIARTLSIRRPAVGVDILLLDLEDFGEHRNWRGSTQDSWSLGSQHWSRNPHRTGYTARFGILLDMVGGSGAVFQREGSSVHYAPAVVRKVWDAARKLGLGKYFVETESDPLIDDHVYINQIAHIPTVDIIDYDARRGGFPLSWHAVGDTLDKIDRETLAAVGRTVLEVLHQEK